MGKEIKTIMRTGTVLLQHFKLSLNLVLLLFLQSLSKQIPIIFGASVSRPPGVAKEKTKQTKKYQSIKT